MRLSRNHTLMQTAYLWAQRSTCSRLQVGCVIHREGRILVQGYNGAPSGLAHCNHDYDDQPCLRAVHAEQNAISFAARWGVGLEGAELLSTHQPCLSCAMSIINAGIQNVLYAEPYRLRDGHQLLEEAGIGVGQMVDFPTPDGVE